MEYIAEALRIIFSFDPEVYEIIGLTLRMTATSTLIASLIGVFCGSWLGQSGDFVGKKLIMRIVNTFMSLPPVVAGLFVYLILSRNGPLGSFELLYSFSAMVIAQIILIVPIVTGLTSSAISDKAPTINETCKGLNISKSKTKWILLKECKNPLLSAIVAGFGRAMSEVGAINIVGGNIQFRTRTITTAIMTETSKGEFAYSIALGIILLAISFFINWLMQRIVQGDKSNDC